MQYQRQQWAARAECQASCFEEEAQVESRRDVGADRVSSEPARGHRFHGVRVKTLPSSPALHRLH